MVVFGKKKSSYPLSRKMLESAEDADMVEDCMSTYADLVESGADPTVLPLQVRQIREASLLLLWLLNGGNGFDKYDTEEIWNAQRVELALEGVKAVGAENVAERLRRYVEEISAAVSDPPRLARSMHDGWTRFERQDLRAVEETWLNLPFAKRAKRYLLDTVQFNVVSDAQLREAFSTYRAGL